MDAGNKQHWELQPTMRTRWKKGHLIQLNSTLKSTFSFQDRRTNSCYYTAIHSALYATTKFSFNSASVQSSSACGPTDCYSDEKEKKEYQFFLQCVAWWSWWWSFTIILQLHRWYTIKLSNSHQSEKCFLPIVILVRCPLIWMQCVSTFSNQADVLLLWSP